MVDTIIHRQTDNIVAKKNKDKKINNGRHNNTQTNRQYSGQETKRQKDNNGRHNNTQTNRQYNGQETKGQIENGRKHNIQKNKQKNCEKVKKDKQWWTRYYTE